MLISLLEMVLESKRKNRYAGIFWCTSVLFVYVFVFFVAIRPLRGDKRRIMGLRFVVELSILFCFLSQKWAEFEQKKDHLKVS
jgi:hypothetical protein